MSQLKFSDKNRRFDGKCVRFTGFDGQRSVSCGVTIYALKHHDPSLPLEGLLPAELFIDVYDKLFVKIHEVASRKYKQGIQESEGAVEIMVHDEDW